MAPISADGPVCRASGHWRPRVAADSHRRGGFCSDAAGGYYRRIAHPLRPERAPVSRVLPRRLSPFYHHTGTPRDERSTSRWWRRHRPSVSIAPRRSHTPGRHTDLQREDPRVDFVHVEAPLAGDPNPGERSKRDPAADGPPASESFEGPGSVIGRQQPARARVRGPRGRARPRPAFMAKRTAHAGSLRQAVCHGRARPGAALQVADLTALSPSQAAGNITASDRVAVSCGFRLRCCGFDLRDVGDAPGHGRPAGPRARTARPSRRPCDGGARARRA